ncbi:hypothetical protein KCP74_01865 [Salmonella enterica subsp. enterica]|nr:hypothetical protein KCP74_01865 [Salmonella enterica subsp. enterica]
MKAKIPQDEPASANACWKIICRRTGLRPAAGVTVIEQQVTWITRQLPAGARILDLGWTGFIPPAGVGFTAQAY